ncbi:molybdenum cofactor biosynthesis protein MoaE [Kocuria salsicia]|uniref:molybdenum cofactor biosynthesis protein MoaE n=1 Tax=Kocuria salsicia TaxID=664639 RepID=UPI00119DC500|nr:molybdenum cofactor biosynthesis protein MoaE [Kocuria salsicia]
MSEQARAHVGSERPPHRHEDGDFHLQGRRAVVLIVSTSAAAGTAQDRCGPLLAAWLERRGVDVAVRVLPDGPDVLATLRELTADSASADASRFVITSGGTGLNLDDVTPEATARVVERETPGIMHALWSKGLEKTPTAVMSRGVAGTVGQTFVVNLPGSRGGVKDGMAVLDPLLDHISAQLEDVHGHGEDRRVAQSADEIVPAGQASEAAGDGAASDRAPSPRTASPGPAALSTGVTSAAATGTPVAGRATTAGVVVLSALTADPLDAEEAQRAVADPACGAVVGFSGVIRDHDGGRTGVTGLEYTAHPTAQEVLRDVVARAAAAHPGTRVWAAHRIGALAVGDSALEVAVAAAHRRDAFEACADVVDRIKESVPIWKRESFQDGAHAWVGLDD